MHTPQPTIYGYIRMDISLSHVDWNVFYLRQIFDLDSAVDKEILFNSHGSFITNTFEHHRLHSEV